MKYVLLVLLLPLLLIGCGPRRPNPGINSNPGITTYPAVAPGNVALSSYHWQIRDAKNAQGMPIIALLEKSNKPIQLDFTADRFTVSNTCNNITGQYSLSGNQITFGQGAMTRRACIDPLLANLDNEVSTRLMGTMTYSLQRTPEPYLVLTNAVGDTLTFAGTETPDMAYGNSGETMYLEVAPQLQPCNNPLSPTQQCLQVRRVQYDTNGLRTGTPGTWEILADNIQGYTHQAGTTNVIRVKRYTVANPAADRSAYAYVLDTVIESR